ncbi:MAG TPA: SDR family oxidoreductase [Blastocatellia bacterium]|nr:SDR family oxidoreductase [Blastocatellia bacterium]
MADSAPSVEQRVVLVTGASSGIGELCARHLASRGYLIFGTSRRPTEPNDNAVRMVAMDVDSDESVGRAVAEILSAAGRIDAVVNNAGFGVLGAVEDTSIEEAKAQMETNFFGVLRVCRAVLPVMRLQRSGHIINISSLAGIVGLPFNGLYCASKFALEGLSESLRLETRHFGVHVVLVEPGDFQSRFPAKRVIAKSSETNPAYRDAFNRFKGGQEKDESTAPTPEPVALLVERILQSRSPRTRYTVGMLGQRIVVPLKRILPQRIFEWAFRKAVGL